MSYEVDLGLYGYKRCDSNQNPNRRKGIKSGLKEACKDCLNKIERDRRKGIVVKNVSHLQDDGELSLLILF